MASASVKSFEVDIATNPSVIQITPNPVASFASEFIPVNNIVSMVPIFFDYRVAGVPVAAAVVSYAVGPYSITIPGIYTTDQIQAGDLIVITGSTAVPVTKPVLAYTTAPETIKFNGVYTPFITAGDTFVITGSTNNDGSYTVISAADDGTDTTVTVVEVINPAITDGNVTFTPLSNDGTYTVVSIAIVGTDTEITIAEPITPSATGGTATFTPNGNVENNDSGDSFRETYPYPTMTIIVLELVNSVKVELELQSITNQPTWSGGTLVDLQTAAAAIGALL
jgi:hypothetical protein